VKKRAHNPGIGTIGRLAHHLGCKGIGLGALAGEAGDELEVGEAAAVP
jgi:hypothetical protein